MVWHWILPSGIGLDVYEINAIYDYDCAIHDTITYILVCNLLSSMVGFLDCGSQPFSGLRENKMVCDKKERRKKYTNESIVTNVSNFIYCAIKFNNAQIIENPLLFTAMIRSASVSHHDHSRFCFLPWLHPFMFPAMITAASVSSHNYNRFCFPP